MPWLSDAIWREWNDQNPLGASLKEPNSPISGAVPTPVTEDDRRRAPSGLVPTDAPVPPPGSPEDHSRILESTPGEGYIGCVNWPVCCSRLTTLIGPTKEMEVRELEALVGPLDLAVIEADNASTFPNRDPAAIDHTIRHGPWGETLAKMRIGKHGGDGINFFQCRSCGRIYVAASEP